MTGGATADATQKEKFRGRKIGVLVEKLTFALSKYQQRKMPQILTILRIFRRN